MTAKNSDTNAPRTILRLTEPLYPLDFEFKPEASADAFAAEDLPLGLCVGSKSGYRLIRRRHFLVPNANVFCRPYGKVWWGDLDIWCHAAQLERVARRLRCRLYVLNESEGRFNNANLPFKKVRRVAVWHTGGRRHLDRGLVQKLGLPLSHLAALVGVSAHRLARPQIPYVAQQIEQKLRDWDESVGAFARELGFRNCGDWFFKPNSKLAGSSPLQALRAGKSFSLAEVFDEIFADEKRLEKLAGALLRSISLPYGTISLEWPRVERLSANEA